MPQKDPKPSLKERAANLKSKLKALLPRAKRFTLDFTAVCLTFASIGLLASRAPELHDAYIRSHVGSKVYLIKGTLKSGGGTGFQVRGPSGQDYLLTNSHVCNYVKELRDDKNSVLVEDDAGKHIPRRILAISDETDLCLIEGMPGVAGLSLGNTPAIGDRVQSVGHPHLRPITLATGEIVGSEDVDILDFIWPTGTMLDIFLPISDHPGKCDLPKNEIRKLPIPDELGGGELKSCWVITKKAYMTSVVIYPGNSGSPVVDYWGRVIGVVFAAMPTDNYGDLVSLDDIRHFLAQY